jgi:hypothetical protein
VEANETEYEELLQVRSSGDFRGNNHGDGLARSGRRVSGRRVEGVMLYRSDLRRSETLELERGEPTLGLVAEEDVEILIKGKAMQRIVTGKSFSLPSAAAPTPEARDTHLERLADRIAVELSDAPADLVVLPELSAIDYSRDSFARLEVIAPDGNRHADVRALPFI